MTKFYGIYFCDPVKKTRTACLILNTNEHDPDQMTVSKYSRLFPYSEASKMKRFVMTHYFDSFEKTFEHVQKLLNTDKIWSSQ